MTIVAGDDAQLANLAAGSDLTITVTDDLTADQIFQQRQSRGRQNNGTVDVTLVRRKAGGEFRRRLPLTQVDVAGDDAEIANLTAQLASSNGNFTVEIFR